MSVRVSRPHGQPHAGSVSVLPPPRVVTDAIKAPHRLAMGLVAIDRDTCWLELDSDLATDLRTKRALLAERRDEVQVELATSRPAQREALAVVADTLLAAHPDLYARPDARTFRVHATAAEVDLEGEETPPLERAACCVQEDLCVMEKLGDEWCLTAGVVCFPTRWRLAPQLGQPMTGIHERVPGYREQLDDSANRFFDGLKPGIVVRRGNWSLMDDPALFQPTGKGLKDPMEGLDAQNAGEKVWLRVEHQTLQQLPDSGAILFGIRIHRARLDAVARDAEAARGLLAAVDTMSPAMQLYKSLARVRQPAVDYLQSRLREREAAS
jgi:hypothetical protein